MTFSDADIDKIISAHGDSDVVEAVHQLVSRNASDEKLACMSAGLSSDLRHYHCGRLSALEELSATIAALRRPAG